MPKKPASDPLARLGKYRKAAIAVVGGAVLALGAGFGADSTVYTVVVAALTALGVYAAPNSA